MSGTLIKNRIHTIRGVQVMLDSDLAELYGVTTKRLNEQVKRNSGRFPGDFMFQLGLDELKILRSQFATSSSHSHGGRRYAIYVFTEQGVAMLSSVLRSNIPAYLHQAHQSKIIACKGKVQPACAGMNMTS